MTHLSPTERDHALSNFLNALAARDVEAVYRTVTPDFIWRLPIGPDAPVAREIANPQALAAYFDERSRTYTSLRFLDNVRHHAPEATFLTFRVAAERRDDGATIDVLALERYLFRNGLVAEKDAYWKIIGTE